MKSRPILFSGAMVRALLAGTKTQTRRIVQPQPESSFWDHKGYELVICDDGFMRFAWKADGKVHHQSPVIKCRYGNRGDQLWVRESIRFGFGYNGVRPCEVVKTPHAVIQYEADDILRTVDGREVNLRHRFTPGDLRPSIHMPRVASRITLEIIEVRVQRLQAISEDDAIAEGLKVFDRGNGVRQFVFPDSPYDRSKLCHGDAGLAYLEGWDQINGEGASEMDPLVWALSFKRVVADG